VARALPLPAAAERVRSTSERALAQLRVVREVASVLEGAGVPWMLWKGPALMKQAWDDATLRVSGDLDVVVLPADRDRARAALGAAGWAAAEGLSPAQERVIHATTRAYPLLRGAGEMIELHWAFAGAQYPEWADVAAVMARAELVSLAGVTVRTPGGADALLLLALHATKHGWSQADEVVTFAKLTERSDVRGLDLYMRAVEAGAQQAVELAWELASILMPLEGDTARDGAGASFRFRAPIVGSSAAAGECIARMCAGAGAWRETHAWTLSWMQRRGDRLHYWFAALFAPTPQESNWVRLPAALAFAYPLVRLARLTLRAAGLVRR